MKKREAKTLHEPLLKLMQFYCINAKLFNLIKEISHQNNDLACAPQGKE